MFQVWCRGLRILKISPLLPSPFRVVYHLHGSRKIWWWAIWVKIQWESGAREGGGQWFPSLWSVFLWDQNILPSFIKEGKKEKASQTGMAKVFFYSPTTSLLPPSEHFRMEKKRPFTGEDLGVAGKKMNLHRFINCFWEYLCLSVSDWIYLWAQAYYCGHKENTEPTQTLLMKVHFSVGAHIQELPIKSPNRLTVLFQFISLLLFTHTGYSLSHILVLFTFR